MSLIFLLLALWILYRFVSRKRTRPECKKQKKVWESRQNIRTASEYKGRYGESQIARMLKQYQENHRREYMRILRNVYVPYRDGTSEIDLVMIHEKGIFVFESKFYGGWIYGSPKQEYWTQVFPDGEKYKFYNPIRQNNTHMKALSRYLRLPLDRFYSYIIFSDQCELRKIPESRDHIMIIHQFQLIRRLWDSLSGLESKFSAKDARRIAEKLTPLAHVEEKIKKRHIAYVQDLRKR